MIYGIEEWGIRQPRHYPIYLAIFQELVVTVKRTCVMGVQEEKKIDHILILVEIQL